MSAWPAVQLRELTTKVGSGATPRGGSDAYKATGVPLIRSMNVHLDGFRDEGIAYLDAAQAAALDNVVVAADDVLLNITGASIGRVTLAPARYAGARVNQHVCIIRPTERLLPGYLRAFLASPAQQALILSAESGATRQALTKEKILNFEVPLPPVDVQQRMVLDIERHGVRTRRARAALDDVPALLERFRQAVLAAAFRGDLTADWRAKNPHVEPASELLKRIRAERRRRWEEAAVKSMTAKGKLPADDRWKGKYAEPASINDDDGEGLPEGWVRASLSEVAELQLGQRRAPEYANEAPFSYIRAANITWDGLDLTDVKTMGFGDPRPLFLERGDVLLSEASGSPSEVGKPALWRGEIAHCCFQATVLRLRPINGLDVSGPWLHLAMLHDALSGRFASMAPGVGMVHLTSERMLGWPVAVAPALEQALIVERVSLFLHGAKSAESAIRSLQSDLAVVERQSLAAMLHPAQNARVAWRYPQEVGQ